MVSTATPGDGVARASKFAVSKVSTGGGGETRVVETARARTHFRDVAIARRSKHSSFASAVTSEPRGSIMRRCAASMASRAASRVLSRWRRSRRCRCGFSPPGGRRANVPRPLPGTPGLPELQRCGLGGDAHPFTPSTRHVTNSGSSPSSAEPRRVVQASRDPFAFACASSSLGPWSDDPSASMGGRDRTIPAARIRSGSTPGSCARALPLFASVARFDPRQAGQTEDHGFPRWPVQKPSFQKK